MVDPVAIAAAQSTANRASRRRWQRGEAGRRKRTQTAPLGLADVPGGSVLSDQTLAAIASGQYGFKREVSPNTRPSKKERQRQSRMDRLANQLAKGEA